MRSRRLWLGAALVAALALVGTTLAGPRGGDAFAGGAGGKAGCANKGQVGLGKDAFAGGFGDKGGFAGKGDKGGFAGKGDKAAPGKGGPGKSGPGKGDFGGRGGSGRGFGDRGLTQDQTVDHILAFDKNKDSKVAKDELPERMQDLIAKGDANKDGFLDRDEIKKLATDLSRDGNFRGFAGFAGPGGFGGRGPGFAGGRGEGVRRGVEGVVDELRLADKKKDAAEAVLKGHQENVRKLMDLARSDLLQKMKAVLSEEEFKKFQESLDRQPVR